MTVRCH